MRSYTPFSIARLPRIEFGSGKFEILPELLAGYGRQVLIVTGAKSFRQTEHWKDLLQGLNKGRFTYESCVISGEPSPQNIDELVENFAGNHFDAVLGIGGGSVLDAAKAIAGLLKVRRSVMDYLEGVGPEMKYEGPAVPFIAVPTTAGTGSEATKNAVLSVQGPEGFKKSFRDEKLVAEYVVVDPDLLATCSPALIASNGMDALTQLLESYVSLKSSVMMDAMAIDGLRAVRDGLLPWYEGGAQATDARKKMAYAALISGITLAQTGLGSVHGLASPLGAFYPIPHGVVCGTLVAIATEININALLKREPENIALQKYARLGEVLCQKRFTTRETAWQSLVDILSDWTQRMKLPVLGQYGLSEAGFEHVVAHSRGSSMKTNPIVLSNDEIAQILRARL